MHARLPILLAAAVSLSVAAPEVRAGDAVENYRAIYERQLGLLDVEAGSNRQALVVWYGQQLQQLREDLKKKGDLEGVVAVVAEAERLQASRTLPDNLTPANVALAGLFGSLSSRLEQARVEGVRKHLALLKKYLNALTLRKRELVAAEKLTEATAVNEEIKKMEALQTSLEGQDSKPPTAESAPAGEPPAATRAPAAAR
jgi:hypothetical protein